MLIIGKKLSPYALLSISGLLAASDQAVKWLVQQSMAYIDKYLEWEELASSRKDQIDKEIGRVGTLNGVLVFDFYSGNSANHYLVVSTTAESMTFGTRLWSAYFPVNEAKTLKSLLLKFEAGTFKAVDEDIYN